VHVVGLDRRGDVVECQRAVELVRDGLRLDRAENRRAAGLVRIAMRVLPGDIFVAPPAMRHQRRQVGLRARRHEHPGLLAQHFGNPRFKPLHRRIVAEYVVADLCRRHCCPHAGPRPCHGIAAEIMYYGDHRRFLVWKGCTVPSRCLGRKRSAAIRLFTWVSVATVCSELNR
jgi:hypothetical protein